MAKEIKTIKDIENLVKKVQRDKQRKKNREILDKFHRYEAQCKMEDIQEKLNLEYKFKQLDPLDEESWGE